jgi:IS5 family transposase
VAVGVTNNSADSTQLIPMIDAIEAVIDEMPVQVVADAGYRSDRNFERLEAKNVDGVIALGREGKPDAPPISLSQKATQRMKEKLVSPKGEAAYRRRKAIVEPVFGWIKSVLGLRQFSLRGLSKTNAEWHLVCLAMNLRRMNGGILAIGT